MSDYIDGIKNFDWHSTNEVYYVKTQSTEKVYANTEGFERYIDNIKIKMPEDRFNGIKLRLIMREVGIFFRY